MPVMGTTTSVLVELRAVVVPRRRNRSRRIYEALLRARCGARARDAEEGGCHRVLASENNKKKVAAQVRVAIVAFNEYGSECP